MIEKVHVIYKLHQIIRFVICHVVPSIKDDGIGPSCGGALASSPARPSANSQILNLDSPKPGHRNQLKTVDLGPMTLIPTETLEGSWFTQRSKHVNVQSTSKKPSPLISSAQDSLTMAVQQDQVAYTGLSSQGLHICKFCAILLSFQAFRSAKVEIKPLHTACKTQERSGGHQAAGFQQNLQNVHKKDFVCIQNKLQSSQALEFCFSFSSKTCALVQVLTSVRAELCVNV